MSFDKTTIEQLLKGTQLQPEVVVFAQTTSTNDVARSLSETKSGYYLVVADEQTKGKGSHGRSFYSPEQTGFYCSFTVPKADPQTQMTLAAGVAAFEGIHDVYERAIQLKWVNDLQVDGKKVGGILCERMADGTVIVGIGINIQTPKDGFPDEIAKTATALDGDPALVNELAAAIYRHFFDVIGKKEAILRRYQELCHTLGKTVSYQWKGTLHQGRATQILEDGSLVIEENGEQKRFSSGEISARVD